MLPPWKGSSTRGHTEGPASGTDPFANSVVKPKKGQPRSWPKLSLFGRESCFTESPEVCLAGRQCPLRDYEPGRRQSRCLARRSCKTDRLARIIKSEQLRSRDQSLRTGQQRPPVHVIARLKHGRNPVVKESSRNCHFLVKGDGVRGDSNSRLAAGGAWFSASRPLVGRAVRNGRIIIPTVLVLVALGQGGCAETQNSERGGAFRNRDLASHGLQRFGQRRFVPYPKRVPARGHAGNHHFTALVGNPVIAGIQCDHHGAHFSMNVAEDVGDAGFVKAYITRASRLIKAKVEALAFEQGEYIVKERIPVGKLHHGTHRHHQHMGIEALVPLNQA